MYRKHLVWRLTHLLGIQSMRLLWQPQQEARVKRLRRSTFSAAAQGSLGLGSGSPPDGRTLRGGLPMAVAFINGQHEALFCLQTPTS